MSAITVNRENFENEVMKSDKPVLLDFWAPWCGPCRMITPVIEEIAAETPSAKVVKVNVDEQPEIASAFRVASIPTLIVIKNGKVTHTSVGAKPKAAILDMLKD